MILTGKEILNQIKDNNIKIEPFIEENINPDSYDISIGNYIYCYENDTIDSVKKNKFYYSYSNERIYTNKYVPMLHSKSGIARIGLFVHITADLLNVGHKGRALLQLYPTNDTKVYPKQRIGQISFWMIEKE